MRRSAKVLGAMRLLAAAVVIFVTAYVLSWQILWGGMAGSEAPFHLHLVAWVASTFPNLPWWYPWDGMGVSYREAYPLASHWLVVAASRMLQVNLEGGGQVVQFALMPLTALGLYAFFDWRMHRPLAGLVAAVFFLVSPIGWVEWTHFGLFASWVGIVLFMPSLIALDALFFAWSDGGRGWRFRTSATAFVALTTALGVVSPHLLAAPLICVVAYVVAVPRDGARSRRQWLLVATPTIFAGVIVLSAFWLGAELQYLAVVRSHWAGAGTNFDPGRLLPIDLTSLLSLHPLVSGSVPDLYRISPAVLLPAILGAGLAWNSSRARVFLVIAVGCMLLLTVKDLYRPFFAIPGFAEFAVVAHRPIQLLLSVVAPSLAALGLVELPRFLSNGAIARWTRSRAAPPGLAMAVSAVIILVFGADVFAFAADTSASGHLAYGPSLSGTPDLRDMWLRHPIDVCPAPGQGSSPLCASRDLSANFSISQLVPACRPAEATRTEPPVCRGLQLDDPAHQSYNGDAILVAQTDAWCTRRTDPVCSARYSNVDQQLLDLTQWRQPDVRCDLSCPANHAFLSHLGSAFPAPPARAELNSNVAQLDMAFHTIVGGGITHSYNDQVIPSRELSSWLEQSMLTDPGTTTKSELAAALGIDAVVLSQAQAARTSDYLRMGWQQVAGDPITFVNPRPSGLASEWSGGTAVLVVGQTQDSVPSLYNFVIKRATTGLLPFESAWLVRSTTPYLDDYSQADLSRYAGVILLGYRYHDQGTAWQRLDGYVRGGGRLFVETGWQYVDPDWNAGTAPSTIPVQSLNWTTLDPAAPVVVNGVNDPAFGRLAYGSGGWGAGTSSSVRGGASELIRSGSNVLAARWQLGQGRVVWSGMNLLAHDASSASTDEDQFVASQFAWLFTGSGHAQVAIQPAWTGDGKARLPLEASSTPTLVLFKESLFPGWSAQLETPSGSTSVPLVGSEMDFMLARLDSVPAGSWLVFSYAPTAFEEGTWGLSVASLLALVIWLVRPEVFALARRRLGIQADLLIGGIRNRAARWGDD